MDIKSSTAKFEWYRLLHVVKIVAVTLTTRKFSASTSLHWTYTCTQALLEYTHGVYTRASLRRLLVNPMIDACTCVLRGSGVSLTLAQITSKRTSVDHS